MHVSDNNFEGLILDEGYLTSLQKMLLEHHQETGIIKTFIYRHIGRHLMNRNVKKVRG